MAAVYALEHMFGVIRTHIDLMIRGFQFNFIIENNMLGVAAETCRHMIDLARADQKPAYMKLRDEFANARQGAQISQFVSEDFIRDHVVFWHGVPDRSSGAHVRNDMFAPGQAQFNGNAEPVSLAPPREYYLELEKKFVIPDGAAFYGDQVGMVGVKTTSVKKNIGFKRLASIIASGRIDFVKDVVTLHSNDSNTYTRDGLVKTILDQVRQCPKVPTRTRADNGTSAGAGFNPNKSVLEAEPLRLRTFRYGKGANPNFKDDFVQSLAHGLCAQYFLHNVRLLQTDISDANIQQRNAHFEWFQ